MAVGDASDDRELGAGDFSSWLAEMQGALRGEHGSEVPCGSCTACCTASQFIHIGPDETDTLARIPRQLLFPAPRLPRGHVLMGYDERGHCPMLIDEQCSIYEHRPRTCRTYDCRIFPAAGLSVGDDDKILIEQQASRWRFSHATPADRTKHDAVRVAARYLEHHSDVFADGTAPAYTTQLAVAAIELHGLFLGRDSATDETTIVDPDPREVRVELARRKTASPAR